MGRTWLVLLVIAACSKPKLEGDVEVQIGDCGPLTVAFVSGPRPQPFDPAKITSEGLFGKAPGGGGGGTGWGTIGTGRYGTIGGTPEEPKAGRVPTVSIGQPNANGDLDKAIIRRYIKRNIQKIQYCYEKELLANAKLQGTVSTQFFIKPDGTVGQATASGVNAGVADCVASVIEAIEFPKPKGGGGVQVNYPFTFRPAGGSRAERDAKSAKQDDPPPPEDDDSGGTGTALALDEGQMGKQDADRAEGQYKMKKTDEDPALARQQAIEQARAAGILGSKTLNEADAGLAGPGIRPDYRPGGDSPLAAFQSELVECFRLQTKRYGVAVVDLDAKKVTAHGIEHDGFKSCVKKIKITSDKPLRCSIAFGPMPIEDAPAIDITADAIKLNGKFLVDPRPIVADANALMFKIDAVYEAVDGRVKAALESRAPVALHGPLFIRPINTTPMKILNKVHTSVLAGGDDPVLAVQREPKKWTLFQPIALPVPPVPRGTGASWGAREFVGPGGDGAENENVELSVLVTTDGVWIGLSRVNEFIKVEGNDAAKLEEALKQQKQSAFFVDRTDIEIAGEDDVTYERFVQVIDAAGKVGFTNWQFMDPNGLSARPQL